MRQTILTSVSFLAGILVLSGSVHAQDAAPPPDAQLQAPGNATLEPSLNPAAVPVMDSDKKTDAMPAQPQAARNGVNGASGNNADPCPAPEAALNQTPDDLAKVQADIDRFTLCVQRAQLLERLNESALKNQAAEDVTLGYNPALAGIASGQQNGMPALPAALAAQMAGMNGMPALPASALGTDAMPSAAQKPTAAPGTNLGTTANDGATQDAKKEPEKPKAWTIGGISGVSSNMQATLISPEGDEVRVHDGMRLSDGKTVVVRITSGGVTTRDAGGVKSLAWADLNKN